jgi:hypothetical protein
VKTFFDILGEKMAKKWRKNGEKMAKKWRKNGGKVAKIGKLVSDYCDLCR